MFKGKNYIGKMLLAAMCGILFSCNEEPASPSTVDEPTGYVDPDMQFSYKLQVLSGTESTASPFELTNGRTLSLAWKETCQYSYYSAEKRATQTILREPKASMTLTVSKDWIEIADKAMLDSLVVSDSLITQKGDSLLTTTGKKVFSLGDQHLTFDWSYQAYTNIPTEKADVAVPYIKLEDPEVVSVSVEAAPEPDEQIDGKTYKVYEVTARFSQTLKTVNTPEEHIETMEYIVKYFAIVEVKLVKVVYRKGWEWVDSHDNMVLAFYPSVYRDRIYSTGETFTDTFSDFGHIPDRYIPFLFGGEPIEEVSDGFLVRTMWPGDEHDSICTYFYSASVPKLAYVVDEFEDFGIEHEPYYSTPPGTWDVYAQEKTYENLDISLEGVEVVGADSISEKPSGWYFFMPDFVYISFVTTYHDPNPDFCFRLLSGSMHIMFYDQFLVIDGQMINFLEFRGTPEFSYHKDYITMPNGAPGFVYTTEFRRRFLEKNFYICRIDSIYQQEP